MLYSFCFGCARSANTGLSVLGFIRCYNLRIKGGRGFRRFRVESEDVYLDPQCRLFFKKIVATLVSC